MPGLFDRIKDTWVAASPTPLTTLSSFVVSGTAPGGYQTFSARYTLAEGNIPVAIVSQTSSDWMTCWCTYTAANTLRVDTIMFSSNADAGVTFPAGTMDIFVTPAARAIPGLRETNTFTNSTGQIFRQASTQDGVLLRGRAGGTASRTVEITPATLTASRTLTAPDRDGTIITSADTGTVTNTMLANSTISSVALGGNLNTLTLGTGLGGTSYNGSGAITATVLYGTSATTACVGDDARLSDTRIFTANNTYAFAAGTQALPSITTSGNTSTGGWFPAANTFAVSTNATERLRIDSLGNVGIGTGSPSSYDAKLAVFNGNIALTTTTNRLYLYYASATNHAYLSTAAGGEILFANGTASPVEKMRLDTNGNLGVGATIPKTRLHAQAATTLNSPVLGSATNAPFYVTNNDPAYGLLAGTSSATGDAWLQAQRTDGTATAYNINLNPAGGRVGIGTSSPTGNLTVFSSAANDSSHIRVETNVRPSLSLINSGVQAWSFWVDSSDSNKLKIGSANGGVSTGTPYITTTTGGSVGIGTASPLGKLELANATGAVDFRLTVGSTLYANIYASASDFTLLAVQSTPLIFGTANTERMRIHASGGISFNTTVDPGAGITAAGATFRINRFNTVSEGGELQFCRASDNGVGWLIDLLGSGTGTDPTSMRFIDNLGFDGTGAKVRAEFSSRGVLSIVNDLGPLDTDTLAVGFRGAPNNVQNAAYTFALTDAGKTVYHDEATARTWTIPANSAVPFPIGTCIIIDNTGNAGAAGTITLQITTDTLRRGDGTAGTGQRSIAASRVAMVRKTKATEWVITGTFA